TRLAGVCRAVTGALGAFLAANSTTLDFFAAERLRTLIVKTAAADSAATAIVADIDDVLGPPPLQAGGNPGQPGGLPGGTETVVRGGSAADIANGAETEAPPSDDDEDDVTSDDADADAESGDDDMSASATAVQGTAASAGLTNRVVYAEEIEALRTGL